MIAGPHHAGGSLAPAAARHRAWLTTPVIPLIRSGELYAGAERRFTLGTLSVKTDDSIGDADERLTLPPPVIRGCYRVAAANASTCGSRGLTAAVLTPRTCAASSLPPSSTPCRLIRSKMTEPRSGGKPPSYSSDSSARLQATFTLRTRQRVMSSASQVKPRLSRPRKYASALPAGWKLLPVTAIGMERERAGCSRMGIGRPEGSPAEEASGQSRHAARDVICLMQHQTAAKRDSFSDF